MAWGATMAGCMFAAALSLTFAPIACGADDGHRTDRDDSTENGGGSGAGSGSTTPGGGDGGGMDASTSGGVAGAAPSDTDATGSTPDGGGASSGSQIGAQLEGEHAGDQFGSSVALSGDGTRLIVGAIANSDSGTNAGHARVFEREGDDWQQLGVDLDGEAAEDRSGGSVAISDDGMRVAVGSYLNDGGGNAGGHVRVFDLQGSDWTQIGADIDGPAGRGAGWAVAMSASGQRVVAGGPTQGAIAGVVTVYEEQDGSWQTVGLPIEGSNELGHAVAMSDDGDRIALSLPSAAGNSRAGTTLVYDWDGSEWVQVGDAIEGEALGDTAGNALALSGDGSILAIGAERNIGLGADGGGGRGGHARVYELASGTWTQLGADLDGEPGSALGWSIALSTDGTRLIVGAVGASVARSYLFVSGAWVEGGGGFGNTAKTGHSVAISADGEVGAVGSVYYRGTQGAASGAVRVYALSSATR